VTEPASTVRKRGRETVADMARSMAVVGGVVALLFLVVWWQRPEGGAGTATRPVDVAGVIAAVRIGDALPVWEPHGLTSGWRPTAAWFAPASQSGAGASGSVVLIGYLTPSGSYAEVRQTDADAPTAVANWTDGGVRVGSVQIGGRTWHRLQSATTAKQALVTTRTVNGRRVLVLVTGKAGLDELTSLAGSLH